MIRTFAFVACCFLLQDVIIAAPRACIPDLGCVRGKEITYRGNTFEAFMGIPYAKKPVNDLRFANPLPETSWRGDLDATQPKADCIQKDYLLKSRAISGEEDCLYLNIYRPKERLFTSWAVMVFIHGGGLFSGSANPEVLGPEYFMESKQVMLVTFSYRLGPFGFLATCDENIPGNMGFKDQSLVLKWVNKYISAFDGHPGHVTLFGHGAGGAAVQLHMLSKQSKDLFERAIVMSGSAASPHMNVEPDPLLQTRKLARFVGIRDSHYLPKTELVQALRGISAIKILEAVDDLKEWDVDPLMLFRPVIEFPSEEAFLTADPKYTIASGQYKKFTWMTGFVTNEGGYRGLTIYTNESLRFQFNRRFNERFLSLMQLPPSENTARNIDLIKKYYFGTANQLTEANYMSFLNSLSDRIFLHPFIKTLEQYINNANLFDAPVYLYKFNYRGAKSYSNLYTGKLLDYGVVHQDDLLYLFRSPSLFSPDFSQSSTEGKVVKEMIEIYTTFATTGKPKYHQRLRPCNSKAMMPPDRICDYLEITNRGTTFVSRSESLFDKTGIRLWDRIVEIFDWCFY